MKWIYLGLIVLLLLTISNAACDFSSMEDLQSDIADFFRFGCDANGPENTVRRLVNAYNSKDWVEFGSCFVSGTALEDFRDYTEEYRAIKSVMWASSPASWTFSIKWTNLDTEVISRESDDASVKADFDIEMMVLGKVNEIDHWTETITLEKIDGDWLISDIVRH